MPKIYKDFITENARKDLDRLAPAFPEKPKMVKPSLLKKKLKKPIKPRKIESINRSLGFKQSSGFRKTKSSFIGLGKLQKKLSRLKPNL